MNSTPSIRYNFQDAEISKNHRLEGWENYPLGVPRNVFHADDVHCFREQLEENSESLFVNNEAKVKLEVLHRSIEPENARGMIKPQRHIVGG